MRNYLMYKHCPAIGGRKSEPTDITSKECVNGVTYIYHLPWCLSYRHDCDVSWWVPKPLHREEVRKTTMLEF